MKRNINEELRIQEATEILKSLVPYLEEMENPTRELIQELTDMPLHIDFIDKNTFEVWDDGQGCKIHLEVHMTVEGEDNIVKIRSVGK